MIVKIERLPLRTVWKDEARDFTRWLQDNLDILNVILDLNHASAEREQRAGAFSVDLVSEDDSGALQGFRWGRADTGSMSNPPLWK